MSNSKLVNCTVKSPNHSGKRTHMIDRITPHCVVGQLSAQGIGNCFTSSAREASCNYGIGKNGDVVLCVDECNRSWCSSNQLNDQRAVTIECASDTVAPYAMNESVYSKLVELCIDICKRNGKKKLIWFADKDRSIEYEPTDTEMIITVHRWFANKACPGDWLYNRLDNLATEVTNALKSTSTQPKKSVNEIAAEVIAGKWGNGNDRKAKLEAAGYNYNEVQAAVNKKLNGDKTIANYYTIKSGDTLGAIARKYKTTTNSIKALNPSLIKDVNKIKVGWKIRIK